MRIALVLLLLAGCDRAAPAPPTAGTRLEAAAVAAGLVVDPAAASLTGSWARDGDRVCVVPMGGQTRIGALIDYADGQGCAASGSVARDGDTLKVTFGGCRFDARFDGERIAFPAELPVACDRLCTGRASLSAMTVERLSGSASEAATLRAPDGRMLCS